MTDQLVIEDLKLAEQIKQIAQQEHRSIQEVIQSMVHQYRSPQLAVQERPDNGEQARQVRLKAYKRARAYWHNVGNVQRARMTDQQLDEEFWLFDSEGIPRLHSDKNQVELPSASLHQAGTILSSAGFRSGRTDISMRSREILEDEFTDYLLSRMNQSPANEGHDDDSA